MKAFGVFAKHHWLIILRRDGDRNEANIVSGSQCAVETTHGCGKYRAGVATGSEHEVCDPDFPVKIGASDGLSVTFDQFEIRHGAGRQALDGGWCTAIEHCRHEGRPTQADGKDGDSYEDEFSTAFHLTMVTPLRSSHLRQIAAGGTMPTKPV